MFAVGCLLLVILPIVGLVAGAAIAGTKVAIWSALAGFVIALALCAIAVLGLVQARRHD